MKTKVMLFPITIVIIGFGILHTGFRSAEAQTWEWLESEMLSYPRAGLSAAVLDGTIFYSGGRLDDNVSFSKTVDVFDLVSGSWELTEPLGAPRWQSSAVSTNGLVFIAGGSNFPGLDLFEHVDIYNKAAGEWTLDELSEPRIHMGVVALENYVFFAGGFGYDANSSDYYDVVDIYDTETGTFWPNTMNLSSERSLIGAAAAGDKVFFAGGVLESLEVTDVVDIYDITDGTWTQETLSEPRAAIGAVSYENKVYFAGGTLDSDAGSSTVDVYNVTTSEWEEPLTLSEPRIVSALIVYDALVFTGVCHYIDFNIQLWTGGTGTIDIYYPAKDTWDTVSDLDPYRVFYAYAAHDKKAYYAGGLANENVYDIINILEYTPLINGGISEAPGRNNTIHVTPNPVSSKFRVEYHLPTSQHVNIHVYNNVGEVIEVVCNGIRTQGNHQALVHSQRMKPGVYFIVLKTPQSITTKKIIKLN
jgi:hypothetical protein